MMLYLRLAWRNIWRHRRRTMIVVLAIGVFALSWPFSALVARRRRVAPVLPELVDDDILSLHTEVPESHPHKHGPDCEHREIRHGDHTDYVHEGHRHASHGDHYDEH